MHDLEAILEEVERKIRQLGDAKLHLSQSLNASETEAGHLRKKVAEMEVQVERLTEENRSLKTARSPEPGAGTADARSKINELVREIDRCIALLNK